MDCPVQAPALGLGLPAAGLWNNNWTLGSELISKICFHGFIASGKQEVELTEGSASLEVCL